MKLDCAVFCLPQEISWDENIKSAGLKKAGFFSESKEFIYNTGDPGSIPGSGRSPGEGNGNPLLYSYLEYPMDRGVWWATVQEAAKSQA